MHHLNLAGFAALALAVAPAHAATRGYIVTDFDNLRLEGPVEVVVETGRGVSARGEGDADMLARVDLAVSARTLVIRLKPSPFETRRERQSGPVKLFLTAPVLRRIQLAGAGSIRARGLDKLNAELLSTGSGSISVSGIATDRLGVVLSGPGSVALAGKARSASVHVAGSGALDAKALAVSDLDVTLEGSAAVGATADRSAKVAAAGPGSVAIAGKAACTVNRTGNGAVSCGGRTY